MADQMTIMPVAGGGGSDLGALLSGIFTGAIGANQLFGGGPTSVSGSAAAGAAAASPFQSQYAGYQPQLQQAVTGQGANLSAASSAISPILQQLLGMGSNSTAQSMGASPGNLGTQINNLTSNYMNNPAIQAQYKLGLDTVNSGLAATGQLGSGKAMLELEQYGQNFASNAYQQQFQNLLSGNAQQFSQGATLQQLLAGELGTAGGLQNSANQLQVSGQQSLIQQLLAASGATTGNPAAAGGILSGQFSTGQQAAANLGSGLSGALSRLLGQNGGSLPNVPGLSNFVSSLFGGGADAAIGGLGGASSFFGDAGVGGLGGLGSSAGDYLGSSLGGAYDVGTYGSFLGDNGATLGGIFSDFSGGSAGAAAAGGAADVGAASAGVDAGIGAAGSAGAGAAYAIPGVGLTLGLGFLGSALTGMQTPQQVANGLYSMGNSVFTPGGTVGINPLYGGLASIFGNVHDASSASQAYQSLLSDEQNPNTLGQLFPNLAYSGEAGVNSPLIQAINSYGQQFVNTPSLWNTFNGVDPAQVLAQQNAALQMIGQSYSGGGG